MIHNDEQLRVVQRQLGLVEDGLAALRREMQGRSRQQFEVMAEPHVEMIRRLRAQIDAYLGIGEVAPAGGLEPASVSGQQP